MSEKYVPKPFEYLEEIETNGVNLSPWEEEFVQSVREQVNRGRTLSEKQREIIERIYSERTP